MAACVYLQPKPIFISFNTQSPEDGRKIKIPSSINCGRVSTHSHPKMAAQILEPFKKFFPVSTHSHPKMAATYMKKQEKSVDYLLSFANLFQNREWNKYNEHVIVIQMN
ncbi:hypothetical protein RHAA1_10301 [Aggregatibacter actinomycetemcomitans RhAA1]|nr:hypothetical protein RHAA1_10301 [Aggregatibacter actinomycetemcomitans RhAA1]